MRAGAGVAPVGSGYESWVRFEDYLAPNVHIVSGKGGVGKTTVAAALALVAARTGRKVCVAEVDRKGSLARLFGATDVGYEPRELSPGVWGINISPEDALAEYLRVQYRMSRIARIFRTTQFVDMITTAAPGLKDILVLGKVWYLEQNRDTGSGAHGFDTIVVDAPAAGHMLQFLASPRGLKDAVRVGPVRRQAGWLDEMLTDPARTRVHLVTLPEEMPVTETLETAEALHERLGISQGPVIANAVYSELLEDSEKALLDELVSSGSLSELAKEAEAVGLHLDEGDLDALVGYARFLEARRAIQGAHLAELRRGSPTPVIELPFLFSAGLALPDIETLADALTAGIEALNGAAA